MPAAWATAWLHPQAFGLLSLTYSEQAYENMLPAFKQGGGLQTYNIEIHFFKYIQVETLENS